MPLINENNLDTVTFEWGNVKWLVTPEDGAAFTMGMLVLFPSTGHEVHTHEGAEEIIYILSGEGEQTIGDSGKFKIGPGDTLYLPNSVPHSTYNTGWEPIRALLFYCPGGAEKAFEQLPDYIKLPVGEMPKQARV